MVKYNVNDFGKYEAHIANYIENEVKNNKALSKDEKAERIAGVVSLYANPFSGITYDEETGKLSVADGFAADNNGFIHKAV